MIDSGHGVMLDYVRATLGADPDLVQEHYSGRTLLHGASAAGSVQIVALLLRLFQETGRTTLDPDAPAKTPGADG